MTPHMSLLNRKGNGKEKNILIRTYIYVPSDVHIHRKYVEIYMYLLMYTYRKYVEKVR